MSSSDLAPSPSSLEIVKCPRMPAFRSHSLSTCTSVLETISHPSAELHDPHNQPDITDGSTIGMPLHEFIDAVWSGLCSGEKTIAVGSAREAVDAIEPAKEAFFRKFDGMFKGHPQLKPDRASLA